MNTLRHIAMTAFLTSALMTFSRDFPYTYEGQTINFTVLDEEEKTCETKEGHGYPVADLLGWEYYPGTKVAGKLVIPEYANDGTNDYKVVKLGAMSFMMNKELTSIEFPSTLTTLGWLAFHDCTGLTSVTIPEHITNIEDGVFSGCEALVDVNLPESMEEISGGLFSGCGFESFKVPASVTRIDGSAFANCRNLTGFNVPECVNYIGSEAFARCPLLTSFVVPEGVEFLGQGVFRDCSGLKSVTLPSILTTLNRETFSNCVNLESIVLPGALTIIDDRAFKNCVKFTSITLPADLRYIGKNAFEGCSKLADITVEAKYPPTLERNAFDQKTYQKASLTVPEGSLNSYSSNHFWRQFLTMKEGAAAGISDITSDSNNDSTLYSLDGRKVLKPIQGEIYIINGKKIIY